MDVNYTLMAIPDGKDGIAATLNLMRDLTIEHKTTEFARELAIGILNNTNVPQYGIDGSKNWTGQIRAIHNFVKRYINYLKDINGVETIQTPPNTVRLRHGDCDDKSLLCATLLETIGHPTRFVAVGFTPNSLSHVFPQTLIGNRWVTLECCEEWPMGKNPKGVKNTMVVHNNER